MYYLPNIADEATHRSFLGKEFDNSLDLNAVLTFIDPNEILSLDLYRS